MVGINVEALSNIDDHRTAGTEGVGSSRRRFLRLTGTVAATAVATVTISNDAVAAPTPIGDVGTFGVVGTVSKASDKILSIVGRDGVRVVVQPTPDASIYAANAPQIKRLTGFVLGERVVAEGWLHGSVLEATSIGSILEPFDDFVETVDHRLGTGTTSSGARFNYAKLVLPGVAERSAIRPSVGQRITGPSWRDPNTGTVYVHPQGS